MSCCRALSWIEVDLTVWYCSGCLEEVLEIEKVGKDEGVLVLVEETVVVVIVSMVYDNVTLGLRFVRSRSLREGTCSHES